MELLSGPEPEGRAGASAAGCPVEDLQRIVPPVCSALALAHARGIIHRDLKPANIVAHDFGDGDRVYKVVDFGVANVRQSGDETRLTGSQQFIGTVAYASPEQLTGGIVDARSDVYSLGVAAVRAGDRAAAVRGHRSDGGGVGAPVEAGAGAERVCPGLPVWLDVAVARALAKDPEDRWQDMASFGRAMAGAGLRSASPTAARLPAADCSAPTRSARRSAPAVSAARSIAACTARSAIRSPSASCAA